MKAIWSWFRAREWDGTPVEPSLGKPAAITTRARLDWSSHPEPLWSLSSARDTHWTQLKHWRDDWKKSVGSEIFGLIKYSHYRPVNAYKLDPLLFSRCPCFVLSTAIKVNSLLLFIFLYSISHFDMLKTR